MQNACAPACDATSTSCLTSVSRCRRRPPRPCHSRQVRTPLVLLPLPPPLVLILLHPWHTHLTQAPAAKLQGPTTHYVECMRAYLLCR